MQLKRLGDIAAVCIFALCAYILYRVNLHGDYWLSGWDNLHPEFDFILNLKRAFFSGWQEYQGLGVPAGHGHAAELPRELLLFTFSFMFSPEMIRKVFFTTMLFWGPLGVYVLVSKSIASKHAHAVVLGMSGGLFYMFHSAVVQILYVPYEAFGMHYGFLPWMIFSVVYYLQKPVKKWLLLVFIVHAIASAQFYIPTLFLVYCTILAFICGGYLYRAFIQKKARAVLTPLIMVITAVFAANAYWLLSFVYFTLQNLNSQVQAYLNFMYSHDIYTKNANHGGVLDALLMRGFMFDLGDFTREGRFTHLMGVWKDHVESGAVVAMGIALFIIALCGALYSFYRKIHRSFTIIFIVFFGLIAIDTPIFREFNELLRTFPLFDQVFRNPFTKFANTLLLAQSVMCVLGLMCIYDISAGMMSKKKAGQVLFIASACVLVLLFGLIWPAFQGHLFYDRMKVRIPREYFALFDYFKTVPAGRVANLPQFAANGWSTYDWGYTGSGFIWYGIENPILDRAFDVWGRDNENYYWELQQALYSKNERAVEGVFEKYRIRWIMLDEHLVGASPKALGVDMIQSVFEKSEKIVPEKKFGKISLYSFILPTEHDAFVSGYDTLPDYGPAYSFNDFDRAFDDYGPYMTRLSENGYYPFRSVFTGRHDASSGFTIEETDDSVSVIQHIPETVVPGDLVLPPIFDRALVAIDDEDQSVSATQSAQIILNGEPLILDEVEGRRQTFIPLDTGGTLEVRIPKIGGLNSFTATPLTEDGSAPRPKSCDEFNVGHAQNDLVNYSGTLRVRMTSVHTSNCLDFAAPQLSQAIGYVVRLDNTVIRGPGLYFSVINAMSRRNDIATRLVKKIREPDYLIIPPKDAYGLGYTFHIDTISLGNEKTVNDFGGLSVYPIAYDLLTGIRIVKRPPAQVKPLLVQAAHSEPNRYQTNVSLDEEREGYLVLYQAYNRGWKAYQMNNIQSINSVEAIFPFIFGREIKDHVLINNWANGWRINNQLSITNNQSTIVMIFWPQYLVYAGFFAAVLFVIKILIS